jgi:hypothetical protein
VRERGGENKKYYEVEENGSNLRKREKNEK